MDIIVREANINDGNSIFSLVKVFSTSFRSELDLFNVSLKNILEDDSSVLVIAEKDKKVIGYCLGFIHFTFYANGKVSWIEEIMVEKALRRKGVGKMLMDTFEEKSKLNNSKLVALAFRRASDFYCSMGFEESAMYLRKLL